MEDGQESSSTSDWAESRPDPPIIGFNELIPGNYLRRESSEKYYLNRKAHSHTVRRQMSVQANLFAPFRPMTLSCYPMCNWFGRLYKDVKGYPKFQRAKHTPIQRLTELERKNEVAIIPRSENFVPKYEDRTWHLFSPCERMLNFVTSSRVSLQTIRDMIDENSTFELVHLESLDWIMKNFAWESYVITQIQKCENQRTVAIQCNEVSSPPAWRRPARFSERARPATRTTEFGTQTTETSRTNDSAATGKPTTTTKLPSPPPSEQPGPSTSNSTSPPAARSAKSPLINVLLARTFALPYCIQCKKQRADSDVTCKSCLAYISHELDEN